MPKKNKKTKAARNRYYDYNLVAIVVLLTCFGLVMLYSTSAYTAQVNYENDMQFFGRQTAISIASILIALFISRLDYHVLYYISGAIYVTSIVLMLLVKFSPLGIEVNGARRWLTIIPGTTIQLQPSELAKIAAITFIPCLIIKMGKNVKTLRGRFSSMYRSSPCTWCLPAYRKLKYRYYYRSHYRADDLYRSSQDKALYYRGCGIGCSGHCRTFGSSVGPGRYRSLYRKSQQLPSGTYPCMAEPGAVFQ